MSRVEAFMGDYGRPIRNPRPVKFFMVRILENSKYIPVLYFP